MASIWHWSAISADSACAYLSVIRAAHTDIQGGPGLKARAEHKRVLVDFGGNWCGDCQVLNYYMHQSPNKEPAGSITVLVDVNIQGTSSQNIDIGDKYGVVLKKGIATAMKRFSAAGGRRSFTDRRTASSRSMLEYAELGFDDIP